MMLKARDRERSGGDYNYDSMQFDFNLTRFDCRSTAILTSNNTRTVHTVIISRYKEL